MKVAAVLARTLTVGPFEILNLSWNIHGKINVK